MRIRFPKSRFKIEDVVVDERECVIFLRTEPVDLGGLPEHLQGVCDELRIPFERVLSHLVDELQKEVVVQNMEVR